MLWTLLLLHGGCSSRTPAVLLTHPQTPEQLATQLGCTPQRAHGSGALVSLQMDDECDMKIDAALYLQSAVTRGRLPDEAVQDALGVSFKPQGLSVDDLGSSIEFQEFKVVNPMRGPHVLRARLSTGVRVAFCCGLLKSCPSETACTCTNDCNGE